PVPVRADVTAARDRDSQRRRARPTLRPPVSLAPSGAGSPAPDSAPCTRPAPTAASPPSPRQPTPGFPRPLGAWFRSWDVFRQRETAAMNLLQSFGDWPPESATFALSGGLVARRRVDWHAGPTWSVSPPGGPGPS